MTHDYTRKRGVVHTEILLPPHAPPSFSDRATLWNSVELYEKAGNAQLAREIDAALPIELSREEQIRLDRKSTRLNSSHVSTSYAGALSSLPSFPTRRSSDLDYTRKRGVVHTEILLPPHAPPSFSDRATLWNSVELYEKAGNAQLAREIDAALPIELSREEQIR